MSEKIQTKVLILIIAGLYLFGYWISTKRVKTPKEYSKPCFSTILVKKEKYHVLFDCISQMKKL